MYGQAKFQWFIPTAWPLFCLSVQLLLHYSFVKVILLTTVLITKDRHQQNNLHDIQCMWLVLEFTVIDFALQFSGQDFGGNLSFLMLRRHELYFWWHLH